MKCLIDYDNEAEEQCTKGVRKGTGVSLTAPDHIPMTKHELIKIILYHPMAPSKECVGNHWMSEPRKI